MLDTSILNRTAIGPQDPTVPPMVSQLIALKNSGIQQQQQQADLQTTQQEQQQRSTVMQGQQIALAGQQRTAQDQSDIRAATAGATDPQTGQVDRLKLLSTLGRLNLAAAAQTASSLQTQDLATAKAKTELSDVQLKHATAVNTALDQIVQGVKDQPTYTNAIQSVMQLGLDPRQYGLGPNYDDATAQRIQQIHAQVLTTQQMLEQKNKQAELDEKAKEDAKTKLPTTDVGTYEQDYLGAHNLPDTPANRLIAHQAYTNETKIGPANVRVEGIGSTREYPVIDTQNNNTLQYLNANDLNAANRQSPGRYTPAAQGGQALTKTALIEDIRGGINQVRQDLSNPNMPEFTANQRAQIAIAMNKPGAGDALSAAMRGGVLGSLTTEQQDYLIHLASMKEQAMAMRSVLGAGQGSEDLRDAIISTIPGPRTPSKAYGLKQIDNFETVLNRLERGIPKVTLSGTGAPSSPSANGMVTVQIPGSPPGQIPAGNLEKFKADHPNAQVSQ